ncbi:MAG: molybdopterin-dependent oxidoreductase [Raoultibacter sp.]
MADKVEVLRAGCFFCHVRCGVLVTKVNGRITKIEGDPDNPHNKGFVCSRFDQERYLEGFEYNPNRLKRPLKRVGERGSGQWEEISWDQAFDEIAEKLAKLRDEYGAETLAFTEGTSRTWSWLHYKFTNLFGSPNTGGNGTICYSSDMWLEPCTYGGFCSDKADWPNANLIMLWGRNVAASEVLLWDWVQTNRKERGAKLIVVDPRFSEVAQYADLFLQLRPGTDSALALGMINVIIKEDLYDHEFVENYCYGFDKLAERAAEYPVDKVAEITWVSEDKIVEAARMYATTKPASLPWGQKGGDASGINAASTIRAKAILRAITGNIDKKGGDKLSPPSRFPPSYYEHYALSQEQRDKMIGNDVFPGLTFKGWDVISQAYPSFYPYANAPLLFRQMITGDPYPVKALLVQADNPLMAFSNTKLVFEALNSLELLVVHDYFMTPTAALADYALPAATWLERPDNAYATMNHEAMYYGAQARCLEPFEGGADVDFRDDYEFFFELGKRLGQEDKWWGPKVEGMLDFQLAPMGMTYDDFYNKVKYMIGPSEYEKYKKEGYKFLTPTGKVELYSTVIEQLAEKMDRDFDPLPNFEYPGLSVEKHPEWKDEYPLIMITGARFMPFYHSEHRQPGPYRDLHPDPIFDLHPDTAMELNIADGDWCWIETHMGRIKQRARKSSIVDPRVINVQHDWWFPEREEALPTLFGAFESNVNVLLDDAPETLDPLMGSWQQTGVAAKVYKCEEQ